ncbi:MAG: hypothetical protein KBT50_01195 [Cycloclasticus sp.]|nr:hypothetical protein [Cycloclasticus sp.]
MIDMHCHFLPGIDDGPELMAESMMLARMAVEDGITHTVVTPHVHPGRYENDKASIKKVFNLFKEQLRIEGINLHVEMAAEVRISMEMLPLIEQDKIPFLGELDGYKILLLEFPHGHILPGSDKLVNYLLQRNIRPLIAHPERNKDVIRQLNKIEPFVRMGCLLQLTAGSIAGHFGLQSQQRSHEILNAGWAHVIATDAHNSEHRPPILKAGLNAATELIGEEAAFKLVDTNPRAIISSSLSA